MKPVFFAILLCVPSLAGEYAVLQSGFRIKVERHEQVGTNVRLFTGGDSVIEMPAASIAIRSGRTRIMPSPCLRSAGMRGRNTR